MCRLLVQINCLHQNNDKKSLARFELPPYLADQGDAERHNSKMGFYAVRATRK